ncbi:MAG TPA: hypothetical protein VGF79_14510 [Bacteroidia bacterium]
MKSLKLSLMALAAVFMLSSCNQFIQLVETESVGKDAVTKEGVCENSDIKITYDMWSEDGITYFSIYNKADKPMYIDWKRSVFVYNDWKNDYWVEKSTTESYVVPSGTGKNITYERKTSTVVAERYTFIPPHTYVSVPMTYVILNNSLEVQSSTSASGKTKVLMTQSLKYDKSLKTSIPSTTGKGNVKAYVKSYSKETSDNRFRNFITYAFDEKFATEKYVENEFYVSKKTEMSMKNFNGKYKNAKITVKVGSLKAKGKVKVFDSPYRNGTSFYNTILK